MHAREVSFLVQDGQAGVKKLSALFYGQREHPPVLMLHGFQDNANSFHFLAPRLADQGFFCVCLEFTGHGRSDHSNSQLSHFSYVYDVMDAVNSLQIDTFHLIGHSMGGIVSCFVAGALCKRVLTLTLLDAIGAVGIDSASMAPLLLEQALMQRQAILSRRPRVYDTFEECISRWSESPWAPRGQENLRLIVSRGTEEIVDPNGFVSGFRFRHDPKLKSLSPFRITEETSREFLKRVACPVVVVLANDREWQEIWPEAMEKSHMELLRAKVFRVKGGHHPHMTNVEETLECIMTLLEPFRAKSRSKL